MTPEEIVAKALCFEEIEHDKAEVAWPAWKHLAKVALTALSTAGFVVVPREPTQEMLIAANAAGGIVSTYKAMLSAYTPPTQNEDKT